jgi:hypothetical protein
MDAANGIKAIARRKVKALTPHIFVMSMSTFCSIPNADASDTERADCSRLAILGGGGLFQRNSMRCGIFVTRSKVVSSEWRIANSDAL